MHCAESILYKSKIVKIARIVKFYKVLPKLCGKLKWHFFLRHSVAYSVRDM